MSFSNFVIILVTFDFVNHSYAYRTNWTPLGPSAIINRVDDNAAITFKNFVIVLIILKIQVLYQRLFHEEIHN